MEIKELVINSMNCQYKRYNHIKELIPFVWLCRNENVIKRSRIVGCIIEVATRSIQVGNFRRAAMYIALTKNILDSIEKERKIIEEEITKKLLEE